MILLLVILVIAGWLLVRRPIREHGVFNTQMQALATLAAGTGATGSTASSSGTLPAPNLNAPPFESPYDAAETDRIFTLSPRVQDLARAHSNVAIVKVNIAREVADFYTSVYRTKSPAPVTDADIDAYLAFDDTSPEERAAMRDLLQKYFLGSQAESSATGTTAVARDVGATQQESSTESNRAAAAAPSFMLDSGTDRPSGGSVGATGTQLTNEGTGKPRGPPPPASFSSLGKYDSPYSPEETRRIVNLSPSATALVTEGYAGVIPPDGVTKPQIIARFLTMVVAQFYDSFYKTATIPVTYEIIGDYVDTTYASSSRANRAAYKDLLRRYYLPSSAVERTDATFTELDANADQTLDRGEFREMNPAQVVGLQEATAEAAGGGAEEGAKPLGEFERSLYEYRAASTYYRLTGDTSYKTQADGWKQWIDRQIEDAKTAVSDNASYIQDFIRKYETSDEDLAVLQSNLRMIREKGPAIQAQYETEKEAQKQPPLDFSPFYTKAGILAAVLAGVIGLSAFA